MPSPLPGESFYCFGNLASSEAIRFRDSETGKQLRFFTNNFTLPALTIAQIYKQR